MSVCATLTVSAVSFTGSVTATPTTVTIPAGFIVTGTATNTSTVSLAVTLRITYGATVLVSNAVTIAAGASASISHDLRTAGTSGYVAGAYVFGFSLVQGITTYDFGTVTVTLILGAIFTGTISVSPTSIAEDNAVTVTATLRNDGDTAGTVTWQINVTPPGGAAALLAGPWTVTLNSTISTSQTASYTPAAGGSYSFCIA